MKVKKNYLQGDGVLPLSGFRYFSPEELILLDQQKLPRHVAIIMDGNRRWAKKNVTLSNIKNPLGGHWEGAKVLTQVIEAAKEIGVKILTVYSFSTENWTRPPLEIQTIFHIFKNYLENEREKMVEEGVKFSVIGNLSPLPLSLQKAIDKTQEETKNGDIIEVVVAVNYGGRDEIKRTICKLAVDLASKKISEDEISEEMISKYLDTARWPDPDLLIRTSGEMRLSNFLLWQSAYTEVYVTDVLWPDFKARDLFKAVLEYQGRERRKGQ